MRPVSRLLLLTLTVALLALLHVGLAWGNTLYVKTSGNDSAACTAAEPCRTIKHAVSVANSGDAIQVGVGAFSEDNGVIIDKNLTITGSTWLGTQIRLGLFDSLAHGCCPVFTIGDGAKVALTGMRISGGNGLDGAGIYNRGTLSLAGVAILDNQGDGGIVNEAWASMATTNVAVEHNGRYGLWNRGTADLVDTRITGTYGGPGALGIRNEGTLTVDRGLVAGNQGTGVWASNGDGGRGDCPTMTVLANVTITGNSKGGVVTECGAMTLKHVTIAGNTNEGVDGGGLSVTFHGLGDSVVLLNSIVAANSAPQCSLYGPGILSTSIAYSLLGDNSCHAFPTPDNLIGVDPKLGGLSYKGVPDLVARLFLIGATRVLPLLPGSPAIDSAGDAYCIPYDQVGNPRPIDGNGDGVPRCDMGAYEYRPASGATSDQPR